MRDFDASALLDAWEPEPPDGMRERVLRKALEKKSPKAAKWRFALAAIGIFIVLVMNFLNFRVQARITAMTGGGTDMVPSLTIARILEHMRDMDKAFADDFFLYNENGYVEEGDTL